MSIDETSENHLGREDWNQVRTIVVKKVTVFAHRGPYNSRTIERITIENLNRRCLLNIGSRLTTIDLNTFAGSALVFDFLRGRKRLKIRNKDRLHMFSFLTDVPSI